MKPETYEFNKSLVMSALQDIQAWEKWTESVPQGAGKTLNLSLIRLTKGLVKAWRIFLNEQGITKQAGSQEPSLPPTQFKNRRQERGKIWRC